MKSETQTLRDVATLLGNDLGNAGVPMVLSFLAVGLFIQQFMDDMSGLLVVGLLIGGSILLGLLLMHFYVPLTGKRILDAIEKDYGPRTRERVFKVVADAKDGDKIDIDISAIARSYGESK